MKFNYLLGAIVAFTITAHAQPIPVGESISYLPKRIFVPIGFDDNDNSQVVLDGFYPNTCFTVGTTSLEIDHEKREIKIDSHTIYIPGAVCLDVLVPYTVTVDLGLLRVGTYSVLAKPEVGNYVFFKNLPVEQAKVQGPDNFLYAPVSAISFQQDSTTFAATISLKGEFTSTCMKLEGVKILRPAKDLVELLPVAKMEGTDCKRRAVPFETSVKIENDIPKGRVLIHVRSLNGQAINQVVRFRNIL